MKELNILWSIEDIINAGDTIDMSLSSVDAEEVLSSLDNNYDPNVGITFDLVYKTIEGIMDSRLSKEEVSTRVLYHGKPLDLGLFTWDSINRIFTSNSNNLVIGFGRDCGITFTTGSNCTITTSHSCEFTTGSNCVFKTGSNCSFKTGNNCVFKIKSDGKFTTGLDCIAIVDLPTTSMFNLNDYMGGNVVLGYGN